MGMAMSNDRNGDGNYVNPIADITRRHRSQHLIGLITIFSPLIIFSFLCLYDTMTSSVESMSSTASSGNTEVMGNTMARIEIDSHVGSAAGTKLSPGHHHQRQQQQHMLEKRNQILSIAFQKNDPLAALEVRMIDDKIHETQKPTTLSEAVVVERQHHEAALHIHVAVSMTISVVAFMVTPLVLYGSLWICRKIDECWDRRRRGRRSHDFDNDDPTTQLRIAREERKPLLARKQRIQNELRKMRIVLPGNDGDATNANTFVVRQVTTQTCPICLDLFMPDEQVIVSNSCGCVRNKIAFHESCAEEWLLQNHSQYSCPCCRLPMIRLKQKER